MSEIIWQEAASPFFSCHPRGGQYIRPLRALDRQIRPLQQAQCTYA